MNQDKKVKRIHKKYILLGILIISSIFIIMYLSINTKAAQITASANEIENEKNLVKMMASHSKGNSADNKVDKTTLKNEFDRYLGNGKITITEKSSEKLLLAFVKTGNEYVINVNTGIFVPVELYTITYDPNGGTGAPPNQEKQYDNEITLSSTAPTRTGYTFKGWSTSSTATIPEYEAGAAYTEEGNKTLYAVWDENYLTVNYYSNYATEAFSGTENPVSGTTNVKVKSFPFYYSQKYEDGLHDYISSTDEIYLARTGYNATGNWGTTATGGTLVSQTTSFVDGQALAQALGKNLSSSNQSINVYAQWSINTYTVAYNANGGSGAPASQTKTYGTLLTLSSTKPTRTGHTFLGWSENPNAKIADYSSGGSYTAEKSATLYAVWEAKKITVTFAKNDGSGTTATQTFTYGVSGQTFSNKNWTRNGYELLGWATSSSATTKDYSTLSSVTNNWINTNAPSITLYAVWQEAYLHLIPNTAGNGLSTDLTNDWYKTSGSYSFNADGSLRLQCHSGSTASRFECNTQIDFTEYNKITVVVNQMTSGTKWKLRFRKVGEDDVTMQLAYPEETGTYTVDISELTGKWTFYAYNDYGAYINISKMYLSK